MITLLLNIANVAGRILLGLTTLDKWDRESNFFNKIAGALAPFQTVIGGALTIIGVLRLLIGHSILFNIASVLGGFLLLTHVIGKSPAFGDKLQKLSDKLKPFKAITGIALIIIGLIGTF